MPPSAGSSVSAWAPSKSRGRAGVVGRAAVDLGFTLRRSGQRERSGRREAGGDAVEGPGQGDGVKAGAGIGGPCRLQDGTEGPRPGRGRDGMLEAAEQGGEGRVGGEGDGAGGRFDQHQGQGVHIGAAVEGLPPHRLRGGVAGGADHGPCRFGPAGLGQGAGQAEVGHGDAPLVVKNEIGRLDVAVNQTAPVGVVEGARHVGPHRRGLGRGQEISTVEESAEAAALQKFHDQIGGAVVVAPVVDLQDIGMPEGGSQAGLGLEAASERFIGSQPGMKDLDGDPPAQIDIFGHVDVRRRPHPEGASQAVTVSEDAPHRIGDARRRHKARLSGAFGANADPLVSRPHGRLVR